MGLFDFFKTDKKEALDKGLEKTKESVLKKIARSIAGKSKVDDEVLDNLEEILITSDVGVDTTLRIIERIEKRVAHDKFIGTDELQKILREEIMGLLAENDNDVSENFLDVQTKPYVIMVVGVNGVGKTTTIGKLAAKFKEERKNAKITQAELADRAHYSHEFIRRIEAPNSKKYFSFIITSYAHKNHTGIQYIVDDFSFVKIWHFSRKKIVKKVLTKGVFVWYIIQAP